MLLSCRKTGSNTDRHEHSRDNNDRHCECSCTFHFFSTLHITPLMYSYRYSTARTPARSCARFSTPSSSTVCSVPSNRRRLKSSTSPWCAALSITIQIRGPLLKKSNVQPGVADLNIQRLVEEKVNAFWKGLESVALKRGEVQFFFRLSGWNRGPDLVHWSKISVTLSKKDQRKAWLGMTTYEVRRVVHSISQTDPAFV